MKGQIILPTIYATRHTDNYKFLLKRIVFDYGLSYEYTDDPVIKDNTELIITFAIPQHNRFDNYPWQRFIKRQKGVKLIAWLRDIQCYDKIECYDAIRTMMDSADIILSNSYSYFEKQYPEFINKMYFMGDFFADELRYLKFDVDDPVLYEGQCLLSGSVDKDYYPLRFHILENRNKVIIPWAPPPTYRTKEAHIFIGYKYAELLNSFFCCATDCSVFEYALSKHMEIPAAGSLLITDTCNDLLKLGYEPDKHYVGINKDNAIDKIYDVLTNTNDYQHIRKQGYEFVRANHALNNRVEELSGLIERIMNEKSTSDKEM